MEPPQTSGTSVLDRRRLLLQAAADGDLELLKSTALALHNGKGFLKDAVEGYGVLQTATASGRMDVCVYLVEELGLDVDVPDESGHTPLVIAILKDTVKLVEYLINHGANPNILLENGCPLHIAAEHGNCDVVEVLISKGANVDSVCNIGTPLHVAVRCHNDGVIKILLQHGADCNNAFGIGYTPLYMAVTSGSLKCVELLIEAGAAVDGVGRLIPLVHAASEGLTNICECLLEAGANPNIANEEGLSPIEIAARSNRREVVELLFPRTSHISSVNDWSVEGILHQYVKSSLVPSFFCMHCHVLLKDETDITSHCRAKLHSRFYLITGDTMELVCGDCSEDFSSRTEADEHQSIEGHADFYLKEKLMNDEQDGFVTPGVGKSHGDSSIIRPRKLGRTARFNPHCLGGTRQLSFDDSDDNSASSEEENDGNDDSDCLYNSSVDLHALLSDDDSTYEDEQMLHNRALVQMRTLKSLGISSDERRKLRKDFVIAEGLCKARALTRVKKALQEFSDFGFFYLRHESENKESAFVFHDGLKLILMKRLSWYRASPGISKRIKLVLDLVEPALAKEEECIRENMIHYLYPVELKEKNSKGKPLKEKLVKQRVSRAINLLSRKLRISRESLNIRPSPKGLIAGPISLFINQEILTDCNHGGDSANLIPSESDLITTIEHTRPVRYVLLIEKETIFHHLVSKSFHKQDDCIIVTGKGEPDVATRILLRKLKDTFSTIPFYGIFDCNPSGVQILSTYCFGSNERAHDNLLLNTEDIIPIGLFLHDVKPEDQIPLAAHDNKVLEKLIQQNYFANTKNATQMIPFLAEMSCNQSKADIEVLVKRRMLVDFIRSKINLAEKQKMVDLVQCVKDINLQAKD